MINNFLAAAGYYSPTVSSKDQWPQKFFDWPSDQDIDEVELTYTLDINAETFI